MCNEIIEETKTIPTKITSTKHISIRSTLTKIIPAKSTLTIFYIILAFFSNYHSITDSYWYLPDEKSIKTKNIY